MLKKGNLDSGGMPVVIPGSAKGKWIELNGDLRTSTTGSNGQFKPTSITATGSGFHWVEVPAGVTRVLIRAKIPVATATISTSPTVLLYGAWKTTDTATISSTGVCPTDGTIQTMRIDAATLGAAAVTLTLTCAVTTTNNDAVYYYSNIIPDLTGYDLQGANYIGLGVATGGVIVADAAIIAEALFLN